MSFFESIAKILLGDSKEELERKKKVENIQYNQLRLIREHFGNRKDINIILNEIKRRGVWMISANYEMRGNAHPRFPYFTHPVTGDIFVTNRGEVYQYTKPKKGVHPFTLINNTDDEKLLGCYILELAKEEDLIIPSAVLDQGASKLPGQSLADYYRNNPDISLEKVYKQRQNEERQRRK